MWATALSVVIALTGIFVVILFFAEDQYREGRMSLSKAVVIQAGAMVLFITLLMGLYAFLASA